MTLIKNALIMAAGRGNRMRPLTDVIPKALAPYRESTLIEQSIGYLRENGLKVHVTVGHLGNLLSEVLIRKGLVDGIFQVDTIMPGGFSIRCSVNLTTNTTSDL